MSRKNIHKKNFIKRQNKGSVDKTDYLKGFEKFDIPRLELETHEIKNVFPAQGERIVGMIEQLAEQNKKAIIVGSPTNGGEWYKAMEDYASKKSNEGLLKQQQFSINLINK